MPKPTLPQKQPIKPKPTVKPGTRPVFNPSNIGALPDLVIMRGVRTTINPRVLNMCRAGKKPNSNSRIPVLNFSFRIKNIGKGTAYMNRDGVIVSAQATDFHERVFSMSKYYLGGKGGPGHFINSQGNRQNWILKKMAHFLPGKVINATSHLGISYNNRTFTLNRLQELAGQSHKFLLKLTSYGQPGLKESNSKNNKMLVSFTFPRDFCKASISGHGISVQLPAGQTVKPHIKNFQFAGDKQCVTPGGIFTIKGSAFGKKAAGRTIKIGGNGQHQDVTIKSWSDRRIRGQLPRNTRLHYNKNYWVSINSKQDKKGQTKHLSNLQRGIKLCPPTVRVGAGTPPSRQNNGKGTNVNVGLADLVISNLRIEKAACFHHSQNDKKHYLIPPLKGMLTVKNIGSKKYKSLDEARNEKYSLHLLVDPSWTLAKLPSGGHGSKYYLKAGLFGGSGPYGGAQGYWYNISIDAGKTMSFPIEIGLGRVHGAHKLTRGNDRSSFSKQDAESLLGKKSSIKVIIEQLPYKGRLKKSKLLSSGIESNYENNSKSYLLTLPGNHCASQL